MRLQLTRLRIKFERFRKMFKISPEICTAILVHRFNSRGYRAYLSVGRLNCCWSSPAVIFGFRSRRDPWPRFLLDMYAFRSGLLFDEGRGRPFYVGATFVASDWLLNCCWPSSAQWFLVPSPIRLMAIFCLTALETFQIRSEYQLSVHIGRIWSILHISLGGFC
jgi:hypothetical protein